MKKKPHIVMVTIILTSLLLGCVSSDALISNEQNSNQNANENTKVNAIGLESDVDMEEKAAIDSEIEEIPPVTEIKKVGVAMPTSTSERWINDGANMKAKLEALGYEVDLQIAEDDIETQVEQIDNLIMNGADCLVIASIDSEALIDVLNKAKRNGIYVIAYDRLLMNTDAISYYATFDNTAVGTIIGRYIEEKKDLKSAARERRSYTIEFFMGSPDDNNALFLYNGVMEVLQPYLDNGTLICRSGQTSFEDTCILRWSQDTAEEKCNLYLDNYYTDEKLDIACSAFDGFSYGIKTSLLAHGYEVGNDWPMVTGQDAEKTAVQNIIAGYQTMTIYKDTRVLASKCVTMVQAVLEGALPEINDTHKYNNGKMAVPSFLCTSIAVDQHNYEKILIDGGYYTKVQLMK